MSLSGNVGLVLDQVAGKHHCLLRHVADCGYVCTSNLRKKLCCQVTIGAKETLFGVTM